MYCFGHELNDFSSELWNIGRECCMDGEVYQIMRIIVYFCHFIQSICECLAEIQRPLPIHLYYRPQSLAFFGSTLYYPIGPNFTLAPAALHFASVKGYISYGLEMWNSYAM